MTASSRIMADDEIFLKVSPALYFEVLLRRATRELQIATHTLERSGSGRIPVFDAQEVSSFLARPEVLEYLATMLASFTRIRSYVTHVRIAHGVRRRVRFNDMDVDSLVTLCAATGEEHRLALYKRIGDVCLFLTGLFPAHATMRPITGALRMRRSLDDYQLEGQRYYGLAEAHPAARRACRISSGCSASTSRPPASPLPSWPTSTCTPATGDSSAWKPRQGPLPGLIPEAGGAEAVHRSWGSLLWILRAGIAKGPES